MTYNNAIPNAADLISVSQGQLKTNFGQLNSQFGTDHTPFITVASTNGDGFHQKVTFNVPWMGSTSVTGNSVLLFGSAQASGGQLAYANASGPRLLTGPTIATSQGSFFLPGAILMQWGQFASVSDNVPLLFTAGGNQAFPNNCFQVVVCPTKDSTGATSFFLKPNSQTKDGFTVRTGSSSLGCTYWAIGN